MTDTKSQARENVSSGRIGRRRFLKTAGLGVATAAGSAAIAGAGTGEAVAAEPKPRGSGYRETEHIRRIYALARF